MSTERNPDAADGTLADTGLSHFAPYLMNRIMGRYNANIRAKMSALGLSTAKMRALAVLSVEDGIAINTLSVFAVVEQSTLSRALDKLQADGLVTRAADPEDNRSFRVFLTDAGREVNESLWPHMRAEQDRMFAGVDDNQRAAFLNTLPKMLDNVRGHEF